MISRKGEKVWSPNFGIRLQESRVSESTNWVCLTRGGFGLEFIWNWNWETLHQS